MKGFRTRLSGPVLPLLNTELYKNGELACTVLYVCNHKNTYVRTYTVILCNAMYIIHTVCIMYMALHNITVYVRTYVFL